MYLHDLITSARSVEWVGDEGGCQSHRGPCRHVFGAQLEAMNMRLFSQVLEYDGQSYA